MTILGGEDHRPLSRAASEAVLEYALRHARRERIWFQANQLDPDRSSCLQSPLCWQTPERVRHAAGRHLLKHDNPVLPQDDPAGALAGMVTATRFEDIPAAVVDLAKKAILDTLAVTLAGSGWEVSPAIAAQVVEWGGTPRATVLVHGHRVPAPMAAFANGAMARAIDMGDVHETGGHVTEWNVPAMLSVLGIAGAPIDGKAFLAAYIVGAEVGVRASAALSLVRYHTTWGMPGEWNGRLCATASVARLLGLDRDGTWNAMGMAYTVHGMSEYDKYSEGTQMARVQHSFAGDTAVKSVLLTRLGVTAPRGIFQGVPSGILRHIAWDDVQPELLTEGLGRHWQLAEGLSMKPIRPASSHTASSQAPSPSWPTKGWTIAASSASIAWKREFAHDLRTGSRQMEPAKRPRGDVQRALYHRHRRDDWWLLS
jgi:hypothetical protein